MKNHFKCKRIIYLLFFVFSCYSELIFSEQEIVLNKTTIQHEQPLYSFVPEWLTLSVSALYDYYVSPKGVIRLLTALFLGVNSYYIDYLKYGDPDKIQLASVAAFILLIPINFVYDVFDGEKSHIDNVISEDISNSVYGMTPGSKEINSTGLTYFKLHISSFSELSGFHDMLKPLRQLDVIEIKFFSSRIDNEQHLFGEIIQAENNDKIIFDIKLSGLDVESYWIELHCADTNIFNDPTKVVLSVFSEEVINALEKILNGDDYFKQQSIANFHRLKGIDFSYNENLIVVKIKQQEGGGSLYSVCDANTHSLHVQQSDQASSNVTLFSELTKRMLTTSEPESWLIYITKLFFKQVESILFVLVVNDFFQWFFSVMSPISTESMAEMCSICLGSMAGHRVAFAKCGRHLFCAACLTSYYKRGDKRCPNCRQLIPTF